MKKKGSMHSKTEQKENTGNTSQEPIEKKQATTANDAVEPDKETIITEQKNRIEELNDKFLRLYAEFDNYRKRTLKERIELSKTASAEVIASMLPVLDDFERAINAIPDDENVKVLKEGIVLIYNKYKTILTKSGLEEIKSMGEIFNTDIHEAIANISAQSDDQKGKIVDLVEKGYYLNGIVLRFAKVVVAN